MWSADWNVWDFNQKQTFVYVLTIRLIISMLRVYAGYSHNFVSIPRFSRMTSPKLKPKPTVDIECVCFSWEIRSWHVQNMYQVRSSYVMRLRTRACSHTHTHTTSPPRVGPNHSYTLYCKDRTINIWMINA